jgi:hypothetical protein
LFNALLLIFASEIQVEIDHKRERRGEEREERGYFLRSLSWMGSSLVAMTGTMRREEEGIVGVKYFYQSDEVKREENERSTLFVFGSKFFNCSLCRVRPGSE